MEQNQLCSFCFYPREVTINLNSREDLKKKYVSLSLGNMLANIMNLRICLMCIISLKSSFKFIDNATTKQTELARNKIRNSNYNLQQNRTDNEIINVYDSPDLTRNKKNSEIITICDSDDELDLSKESRCETLKKFYNIRESSVKVVHLEHDVLQSLALIGVEALNLQTQHEKEQNKIKSIKRNGVVKLKNQNRRASVNIIPVIRERYWCQNCNFATDILNEIRHHGATFQCTSLHCNFCEKAFQNIDDLITHCIFNHERGEQYCCHFCNFATTNKRQYTFHKNRNRCGVVKRCNYCYVPNHRVPTLRINRRMSCY